MRKAFEACRAGTLALYDDVDDRVFRTQVHPDFSPIGWHLGHLAYVEANWLVVHCGGEALPAPELEYTFDVDGLPKPERVAVPPKDEVLSYAAAVRERMMDCLERVDLAAQERLWRFVLQHECQHGETVTFVKYLNAIGNTAESRRTGAAPDVEWRAVPGGPAVIGSDAADAMDNEGPAHERFVEDFEISRFPVTQAQYRAFIDDGGYADPALWSEAGWAWKDAEGAAGPLYWVEGADDAPVFGVSAYEADAFARWAGARLPTEFEWEKAAVWDPASGRARRYPWGGDFPADEHCNHDRQHGGPVSVGAHPHGASAYGVEDMLGNVWEWTASTFGGYPGFQWFPYAGYSQRYFDGAHRVLRGASWATRPWAMRGSFRNWYHPWIRQILAGFRLARDPAR